MHRAGVSLRVLLKQAEVEAVVGFGQEAGRPVVAALKDV
jgi:hypothetical protein